jgi:hypothetical protein
MIAKQRQSIEQLGSHDPLCPLCSGRGYTLLTKGDIIQGQYHNLRTEMHFCRCQRGGELELLVEAEKGKAFEKGRYSVGAEKQIGV